MKVLLVDDEKKFVSALAQRLSLRGIEADWVTDPTEALERVTPGKYEAAVLDVKMPGMDGIELRRRLAKIDPTMKFILVTGHGSDRDYDVGMKEVSYYIIKPFKIEDLVDKLRGLSGQ
ncbi:MAG: response regulator [Deltaproteobacteria bacterium]|nr:response regulator [Deltaproteobacteria bacterium]MBW1922544.1 response regulator [Deltaproteobacteria bacterium]MBW1948401.1 response regulator [Deltaproteobacteria bacterium]MBW2007090.1 response regulator [Deltaproteobacteria bacterium]MBW2101357.1 response regulator [Deltaproteobacteria bacterium]